VKDPPKALLGSFGWAGPDNAPNAGVDATPLVEYAQESGRRNKIAALWSAAAALFVSLTWFMPWPLGLLAHAQTRARTAGDSYNDCYRSQFRTEPLVLGYVQSSRRRVS
jgi:hypothetical protein